MKINTNSVARYSEIKLVKSYLNPLDDLFNWISGFSSQKYVRELIQYKHCYGANRNSDDKRAEEITEYVKLGCEYIEQAKNGPKELAYLPLYYALLNLAKVYILFGRYANELWEKGIVITGLRMNTAIFHHWKTKVYLYMRMV